MKINLFTGILGAVAIALGTTATMTQPSLAENNRFFCGTNNGVPVTVVRTSRGEIPMIRWVSDYFSSSRYSPLQRCQEVSERFQRYNDNGKLQFIRTGMINQHPVLCFADYKGGPCAINSVLVTLAPGTNPERVLGRLFDLRARAAGRVINLSGDHIISYQDGEAYLDIQQLLKVSAIKAK
ncbi:MAG TPA: COP23 domain-containing protein [Oculatellaceae cyanobacterium]|jgi:hypothetical protein